MRRILLILLLIIPETLFSLTLVYNLRVRRTFAVASRLRKEDRSILVPSLVPIFQNRKRHIVTDNFGKHVDVTDNRAIGGALIDFHIIPTQRWWAEITTGVEREHAHIRGTTNASTSRSGVDDIVLTAGGNFYPINHGQVTFYGLLGLPTRLKVGAIEQFGTFVGTRFFTLGAGAELSYGFIDTIPRSLDFIAQGRFLHIFNRTFEPILPPCDKIQPGNVSDLLLTLQYREKRHIFELGYNPTFFTNQALLLKTGDITTPTYIRNAGYVSYAHLFKRGSIIKKPLLIGGGLNYSFMHFFDTKTFSCWVNFSWIF